MRRLLGVLIALALGGCANAALQDYEARVGALIGVSEAELVRRAGVPTRFYEAEGRRFLAYVERWDDIAVSSIPAFRPGPFGYGTGGFGPHTRFEPVNRSCETTFEVADGRVAGFSHRGSSCGWGGRPMIAPP